MTDCRRPKPFLLCRRWKKSATAIASDATRLRNCATVIGRGISLKDDADSNVPGRLLRRALGGTVTDTLVSVGVYDHTFAILPPQIGDILPSFNILSMLGLANFLLAGVMVDKMKFSQKGSSRATHETPLVGSGKFINPSGITPLPVLTQTPCMDGFRTVIKYTDADDTTVVNLSTLGKVVEWSLEHDNKIRRNKRRTGDPIQTVDTASAAHIRKMPRGKYETKGQITVDFEDLSEWTRSIKNQKLMNLSFLMPGELIDATNRNEIELIVPSFGFDSPDTGDDEGDATLPINIYCFEDPITKGTMKARVRNSSPTLV